MGKRDKDTGRFMNVKQDGTPFKGVRKEKVSFNEGKSVLLALVFFDCKTNYELSLDKQISAECRNRRRRC